ncbi:four helix bundle protein [Candidatus Saccharibacteria bacterium]|nr:four helix bundle protein [Candidatus Saccharibacteria bacterium]
MAGFRDLVAWQEAHKLVLSIYSLTKNFPNDEMFALTSQLRRAAVSTTSNIAEGFSRPTKADKMHFYAIAQGSLTETQSQLEIAKDVGYITSATFTTVEDGAIVVHKLLTGLIKSLRDGKGVK